VRAIPWCCLAVPPTDLLLAKAHLPVESQIRCTVPKAIAVPSCPALLSVVGPKEHTDVLFESKGSRSTRHRRRLVQPRRRFAIATDVMLILSDLAISGWLIAETKSCESTRVLSIEILIGVGDSSYKVAKYSNRNQPTRPYPTGPFRKRHHLAPFRARWQRIIGQWQTPIKETTQANAEIVYWKAR